MLSISFPFAESFERRVGDLTWVFPRIVNRTVSRQSHAPSLSLTTNHRAVKSRFQPNTRYKCDTGTRTWNDRNYEPIVGPDRLRFHLDKIQWRLCSLLLATASVHCSWRLVAVRASSCTFAPILGTRNTEQFCVWSWDPLSKFNLLQMFSYFRVVQIPVPKLSTEILWTLSTKITTLLGQTEQPVFCTRELKTMVAKTGCSGLHGCHGFLFSLG